MKHENKNIEISKAVKKELSTTFNVTPEYVAMVIRGKRRNKAITDAYNAKIVKQAKKVLKKVAL